MSLRLESSETFLRDAFLPFPQNNLSIASSPVLYGLAVYTVFTAAWNDQTKKLYIFRLKDHYDRLVRSSKVMQLDDFAKKWSYGKFDETINQLLEKNKVKENVLIRVSVFADGVGTGAKTYDVSSSLSAYVCPFGEILPASGAHACVSSWQRNSDQAIPANLKSNGSYVNSSLMKNEALTNGYDEAIALNSRGQVSEGTIANIFLVKDNELITPDTSSDILIGITRDTILKLAKANGIKAIERAIEREELYTANEAFFCGSSANVTPILSIDKRPVGNGQIGSLTQKLIEMYSLAKANENPFFSHWLTEVKV